MLEKMMIRWCEEAAEIARRYHRRTGKLEFKYATEAVTEADGEIEELLRRRIGETFPEDLIVGEEFGGPAASTIPAGKRVWQIDPIDGTLNFAMGLPNYCISLALLQGSQVLAACIHQPATGDTFSALAGGGARLNGQLIKVDAEVPLSRSVVSLQLKNKGLVMRHPQLLHEVSTAPMRVRRCGAFALEIAWVAAGFCHLLVASFMDEIHPWDVAAGLLLAEEAGAVAMDFKGRPYRIGGPELLIGSPAAARSMADLIGRYS